MTTPNIAKVSSDKDNFIRPHDKAPKFSDMDGAHLYKTVFMANFGISYQEFVGAVVRYAMDKCSSHVALGRNLRHNKSNFDIFRVNPVTSKSEGCPVNILTKAASVYRGDLGFGTLADVNKEEFGDTAAVQLYLHHTGRSLLSGINFRMKEDVPSAV